MYIAASSLSFASQTTFKCRTGEVEVGEIERKTMLMSISSHTPYSSKSNRRSGISWISSGRGGSGGTGSSGGGGGVGVERGRVQRSLIHSIVGCCGASYRHSSGILVLIVCQMVLLLLGRTAPVHADWLMDCGDCHCKWNSGKKTADCKNLSLAAVPENLSSEVQVLDLSFNRILYLEQNAFLNAQLHNLHKLFIRNSSLQQIDPRTFTQLEILIELDLSNNLLRSLQANLFVRLVKVRALVLNGNLLESLGDGIFQNLKYLHKVELKYNRLKRIAPAVFVNLPLLTQIYLDGNRLNYLRKESFESLKRLTALSLDQNPWNCTCELQIFRDFVIKRNLYTPPTACYYPSHLRGTLWIEDLPEAFACKPKIIYPTPGASINTSKENVTLVCRVHASPNTHIAWDYNKQMYRANAAASIGPGGGSGALGAGGQQQRVYIELLRDEKSKEKEFGRDIFVSRLTILGAEKSDEGVYTCLAENAGGKDVVQMSLLVQKAGSKDLLLQGNLLIVICLMALGLLSVSMFLAMVTCCIYKRFKAINPGHHHHHHHHHLGELGDQLTSDHQATTTTVAGGIDVVLGVNVDDATMGNFKHHHHHHHQLHHHHQKTQNGGPGTKDKYAEALKHGITAVLDNGSGGTPIGDVHADKAYLEQRKDDTLHIKYPHGLVRVDIGAGGGGGGGCGGDDDDMTSRQQQLKDIGGDTGGGGGGGGIGIGGMLGGTEYQPDLLPAYSSSSTTSNSQRQQQQQAAEPVYTPIRATTTATTKTINQTEDHHHQSKQPQPHAGHMPKSKYNSNTLGYLQSKYGNGKLVDGRATTMAAKGRDLPLTTSASLTATGSPYTSVTAAQESGFSTLQRHSKSLVLPAAHRQQQQQQQPAATPTDSNSNGSYEYRQPPPPPYNAAHRTAGGLLLQRRTSAGHGINDSDGQTECGYQRDDNDPLSPSLAGTATTTPTAAAASAAMALIATRETIVTASPSLNYLTTTEYTPRRQLL